MPDVDLTGAEGDRGSRAQQLYDLAQTTIGEYGARDALLERLEPYYFLDEGKDPERTDEEDETLQIASLPHGTGVVELIQSLLANAEVNISAPARSDKKGDLDLADQVEAYLTALLAENDRMAGQALLDQAAWLAGMRGAFCGRVLFVLGHLDKKDGVYRQGTKPGILLQVRDPLVVYPSFGADGLLHVVEQWTRTVADIRNTWGEDLLPEKKPVDEVAWCEMWTETEFCYWADGQVVEREGAGTGPWPHEYGGIPYSYRFAHQTGAREPERRARPILENVRHLIDSMDRLDSAELTSVEEYAGDSLLIKTRDPNFKLDLSPLAQNYLAPDESVEWLRTGRRPLEANAARAKYEQAFQRLTIPYSMYGQDPGRMMSGFSLSLLNQGGQMRLRPIIEAVETGLAELLSKALMVAEEKLGPLLEKGVVTAYRPGEHTTATGSKRTIRQEIALKASMLQGYYEVDVSLGEVLPQDEQSNLVLALRSQQPGPSGRPLLSWRTAVEKFKLVGSPTEERRRIDEEMVAADPEVQALRRAIFAAKVKAELEEEAQELGIDIEQVLASAQQAQEPAMPVLQEPLPGLPGTMVPGQMQGGSPPPGQAVPPELAAMWMGQP